MSNFPNRLSEPAGRGRAQDRTLLRAPTLLAARPGRDLVAPIRWAGDSMAHVRILGVAPAHVMDEAGRRVWQLHPGREYRLVVGAVPATGELVIRLTLDDAPGRPRITHRVILVARRALDGAAVAVDLAGNRELG